MGGDQQCLALKITGWGGTRPAYVPAGVSLVAPEWRMMLDLEHRVTVPVLCWLPVNAGPGDEAVEGEVSTAVGATTERMDAWPDRAHGKGRRELLEARGVHGLERIRHNKVNPPTRHRQPATWLALAAAPADSCTDRPGALNSWYPRDLARATRQGLFVGFCGRGVGVGVVRESLRRAPVSGRVIRFGLCGIPAGAAPGPQTNEKRRLTPEDVERRFRRSAAIFGNY